MGLRSKVFSQIVEQIEDVAQAIAAVAAVAATQAPVLLIGPKGSAIELMARALHVCSSRHGGPFVSSRCGLYGGALLESRLFAGTVTRRAYVRSHSGTRTNCVDTARGGTLFIDQVQASTPMIQRELLRLITDQEYIDPSQARAREADVRIVVSADKELKNNCQRGEFRTDLHDRLQTVTLHLSKDCSGKEWFLEVLALLRDAATASDKRSVSPGPLILQIGRHSWSPAVVTLQEAIRKMTDTGLDMRDLDVTFFDLMRRLAHQETAHVAEDNLKAVSAAIERCVDARELFGSNIYDKLVGQMQRTLIRRVMAECNGAVAKSAQILGISSHLLEAKMKEFGL